MPETDHEFTHEVEEVLRNSVTNTISLMFNIPIDVCKDIGHKLSIDDFVCCGEFKQDGANAALMFSFDRELIKKLAHHIFMTTEADNLAVYESTVTEIVNIVSNQLKVHLNLRGYSLSLDIPHIVKADTHPPEDPLIHMAFTLKDDPAMGVDFYMRTA